MNENFAKLMAIAIVGGVAKALFRKPQPITNIYNPEAPAADIKKDDN